MNLGACIIVAEIGQNHGGDIETAKRLIDMAAECEATAVKFTARDIVSDATQEMRDSPYTSPNSFGATYGEHRQALELTEESHAELKAYAEARRLIWFCTACDIPSVEMLERLGNPFYKVASRDLDNGPLLDRISQTGKPIFLSTGMSNTADIAAALKQLDDVRDNVVLMHCLSQYPADYWQMNLRAMQTMHRLFDLPVGLSDHTPGIVTAQAAVALGACVVEKHVTLSRAMPGTDHAAALEREGLRRLVRNIRITEAAMGDGIKRREPECETARRKLGRSLSSKAAILRGTLITADMVCLKSPGWGITWANRDQVIGKRAVADIPADTTILFGETAKTVAVIAARMGSTRFPGKVLASLVGKPLLLRVIERAQATELVDAIVVATTDLPEDDVIVERCHEWEVPVYRGSSDDVLGRVCEAAGKADADIVVRLLADNPLTDPKLIDELITDITRGGAEYVAHKMPDGTHAIEAQTGLLTEVLTMKCLRRASVVCKDPAHREHVTLGIYTQPGLFACRFLMADVNSGTRLTVDTKEDLERIAAWANPWPLCAVFTPGGPAPCSGLGHPSDT